MSVKSGDSNEKGKGDWRSSFFGRKEELRWLRENWFMAKSGKPRACVLHAESGYGKTKIAQKFYNWLSEEQDDAHYWPDTLLIRGKSLKIMPSASEVNVRAAIPWFWAGVRFDDPNRSNSSSDWMIETPIERYFRSADFTAHEEPLLRGEEQRKRERKMIFLVGKTGLQLASGGVAGLVNDIAETIEIAFDTWQTGREEAQAKEETDRIKERIAEVVASFRLLMDSREGHKRSLPVVLFLDDAHWIDPVSRQMIDRIWQDAVENRWPLFILATHWSREWSEPPEQSFASWFQKEAELRDGQNVKLEARQLGRLNEMDQLLRSALPGLNTETVTFLLERAAGNPKHLTEIIFLTENHPEWFTDEDTSLDLTPLGKTELEARDLHDLEALERRRFDDAEPAVRNILALSAIGKTRFYKEFSVGIAERICKITPDMPAAYALKRGEDPYAIIESLSDHIGEFRSPNLNVRAREHLEKVLQKAFPVGDAIQSEVERWLSYEFLKRYPKEYRCDIYEFLWPQTTVSPFLQLVTVLQTIVEIIDGGNRNLLPKWLDRWNGLPPYAEILFDTLPERYRLQAGRVIHLLGIVCEERRKWSEALEAYTKAIEWKEKTGQPHEIGGTYHQIGIVYQAQRKWSEALKAYTKAIKCNEETGQLHEIGGTYHQIGIVYQAQRKWSEALEAYTEAIKCNEKTGQLHKIGGTYHQIGGIYREQHLWSEALKACDKAIKCNEKAGHHHEIGGTHHQIGMVYEGQRKWSEALKAYTQAIAWKEKTGQLHEIGLTHHQIGRVYEAQRKWSEALKAYTQAIAWKEKTGQLHEIGLTHHQIGRVYEAQRKWPEALKAYTKAIEWKEKTKQLHEIGSTYAQLMLLCVMRTAGSEKLGLDNLEEAADWALAAYWEFKSHQQHRLGQWKRNAHRLAKILPDRKGKKGELLALLERISTEAPQKGIIYP